MNFFRALLGGFGAEKGYEAYQGMQDDKRQAQNMMNEQIKAYREQTELTRNELANKANEQVGQKRRIEEKQIRALRKSYRSGGALLGTQQTNQMDMNSKLGG